MTAEHGVQTLFQEKKLAKRLVLLLIFLNVTIFILKAIV
jgi:hypothetical protein